MRFRLSVEINEQQANAGRDGRTRVSPDQIFGANGETIIFPVQLTTSRICYPVDPYSPYHPA